MSNLEEDEKIELGIYIDEVIETKLEKFLRDESKKIAKNLESRVNIETNVDALVNKIVNKNKVRGLTDSIVKIMEKYLSDLETIEEFRGNIRREIIASLTSYKTELIKTVTDKSNKVIENQKEVIEDCAHQAYDLVNYIENSKERVVNDIVSEATKRIKVEDVRPRVIHIYQNNSLEKILDKELYHQEFETIYKLIRLGIPVMLIGPTGSGKSICAGQVAKALDLPMYYTNNASEEYKLLGFTDAHGKYKETQFYKAFKNGGLFFLDEIDNSHPSALLSLNSAIGATKNGNIYMAFED